MPFLRSLALSYPPHVVLQEQAFAAAQQLFPSLAARSSMAGVFRNAQVERRHIALPLAEYLQPLSPERKALLFRDIGRKLCVQAARQAVAEAQLNLNDIDAVMVVTSTGFVTPALSSLVAADLGLRPDATQYPLVGYGCAGGVMGLAAADTLVRGGHHNVLLIHLELCSLTFLPSDVSPSNFVGLALFADGASAAVVSRERGAVELLASHITLLPDSESVMGWATKDDGLQVIFGAKIPDLVTSHFASSHARALDKLGWQANEVKYHLPHPGGTKVLRAIEAAVAPQHPLEDSWDVLRTQGNMSSVTVMNVLALALRRGRRGKAMLSAMGPGFNICHLGVVLGDG